MGSAVTRRVLEVKPGGPWLVLADGAWAVDTDHETAVPLARSRMWLLPLVQRSRNEVEREAHVLLGPDDPDLGEALRVMIDMGHAGSQATQHAARQLLKHHGHWSP